jgi:hypothetical protein
MHDDDDFPRITCGVIPIRLGVLDTEPADPDVQREVFFEITDQLFDYVGAAMKSKDSMQAVRIMAQGERVMREYIEVGFDLLEPLQRQLRDTVLTLCRMSRRYFIKRALTCSKEQQPFYDDYMKSGKLDGPGAAEDFEAVERHLDEGRALFDDLYHKGQVVW